MEKRHSEQGDAEESSYDPSMGIPIMVATDKVKKMARNPSGGRDGTSSCQALGLDKVYHDDCATLVTRSDC